jgi:hypothetical protein
VKAKPILQQATYFLIYTQTEPNAPKLQKIISGKIRLERLVSATNDLNCTYQPIFK